MYATTVALTRPDRRPVVVSAKTGKPAARTRERRMRPRLARRTRAWSRVNRVTTGRGRVTSRVTRASAVAVQLGSEADAVGACRDIAATVPVRPGQGVNALFPHPGYGELEWS